MLSFMQFISEMHGFHVGLGDINIDDGTGLKDSTSDCGVILQIYHIYNSSQYAIWSLKVANLSFKALFTGYDNHHDKQARWEVI